MNGMKMTGHYSRILILGKRMQRNYLRNGMDGVVLGQTMSGAMDNLNLGRWKG
jgi:hypothetical protein